MISAEAAQVTIGADEALAHTVATRRSGAEVGEGSGREDALPFINGDEDAAPLELAGDPRRSHHSTQSGDLFGRVTGGNGAIVVGLHESTDLVGVTSGHVANRDVHGLLRRTFGT